MGLQEKHEFRYWFLIMGILFTILAEGHVIASLIGLAMAGVGIYQIFLVIRSGADKDTGNQG